MIATPQEEVLSECLARYEIERHQITVFGTSVREFFLTHPALNSGDMPAIHSIRFRTKNAEHLREKIIRKKKRENRDITADSLLAEITDLAGVRVLHLHREQFATIHNAIQENCTSGYWCFREPPVAYTWDPESKASFEELGLRTEVRESHYTSVHYVVKPNENLQICCEIQVRTLFEEVWGEIDHLLNYPEQTQSIACKEQLLVLAKMVGASTRLAESIFRSYREFGKPND